MNNALYKILSPKATRIFLLHDVLKSGKDFTMEELMRYIQEHDRTSSYYSVRSFREDIRTLREEFDAPILPTNRGIYRYDTEFDLYFEFGMTDKFPDLKLRI